MEAHGYKVIKTIGRGSFGAATLVAGPDSQRYVIKSLKLEYSDEESTNALREVKILQQLSHPNVIKYYDNFQHLGTLYIVMEYASSGCLQSMLDSAKARGVTMSETKVIDYFVQISLALQHVHNIKIVHRDISAENVFLTNRKQTVKLGDFGIATSLRVTNGLMATHCGTPYYMSPELAFGKPYNSRTDIWSLGCLLYQMMTYRHPFEAKGLPQLMAKLSVANFQRAPSWYSGELRNLLGTMLTVDPHKRPSVNQILSMPFLAGHHHISSSSSPSDGLRVTPASTPKVQPYGPRCSAPSPTFFLTDTSTSVLGNTLACDSKPSVDTCRYPSSPIRVVVSRVKPPPFYPFLAPQKFPA